jgi:uncharacterized protein (DUF2126 family)
MISPKIPQRDACNLLGQNNLRHIVTSNGESRDILDRKTEHIAFGEGRFPCTKRSQPVTLLHVATPVERAAQNGAVLWDPDGT